MKPRFGLCMFVALCFFLPKALLGATWYVRADGGSRYSATVPLGECDGLADAAYPGAGVNQHCAFGDYRYLWDDQSYGSDAWVIAGGDTVIVDNTKQWRVGFDQNGPNDPWCAGGSGPYSCTNPIIPSGTPTQHTRILGRNYASCSTANYDDPTRMTQLFGGHGLLQVVNLRGAQYVDVQCLELTRHSQCMSHGQPAYPVQCQTGFPLDDYDSDGIATDVGTHDVLLQDMWIHGHTDRGIVGPIGGLVIANRINVGYNGAAGWDFDDGNSTPNAPGSTLNLSYSIIEWNGCNQEYPLVDANPAISCYDQAFAGYGDGIGTPAGDALNVEIDHSIFRYNTQDGEDFGHIDTGSSTLSITNSFSYGNEGGQFKWGPGYTNVVFENNLVEANCARMSVPMAGTPSTYNTYLGSFCRAFDALSFNFVDGATALFANNTIVTYAPTTFDMQCSPSTASCPTTVFTLSNNIVLGYDNPGTYNGIGGQPGGPGLYCGGSCDELAHNIGTINRYNNSYYGIRGSCQANLISSGSDGGTISGETCNDPLFVSEPATFTTEAALDGYNFGLSSTSPAIQAGVAVSGLTMDYNGALRPNPPSLGAVEFVLVTPPGVAVLTFAAISTQTYGVAPFAVSATSASSGLVSYSVTSGPATLSGNIVTVTGVGMVTLSATQVAEGSYAAATATVSFAVAPELPTLSFAAIPNQAFSSQPIAVNATSLSSGAITYSVLSGPATLVGNSVTRTAVGTVTISASQAASGDYTAATATTSFEVTPAVPVLSFAPIANVVFGSQPFAISATSASNGTITYFVSSGPAILSGNTLTVTGAGIVSLSATQAANGNYTAATATTSLTVLPAIPTLQFVAIHDQAFGTPAFPVSATSVSKGGVTYSVVSGPASIDGNIVILNGIGTVVLSAVQAATQTYAPATATTTFSVVKPNFTLTAGNTGGSDTTATVSPGAQATFSLLVSPGSEGSVFLDAVTFSSAGLPPGATAVFSPATIAAGRPATPLTLTVQTSGSADRGDMRLAGSRSAPLALGCLLLPLLGLRAARKRLLKGMKVPAACAFMLMFLVLGLSLSGCGSQPMAQSSQTYTVVVTAMDQVSGWKTTTSLSLIVH